MSRSAELPQRSAEALAAVRAGTVTYRYRVSTAAPLASRRTGAQFPQRAPKPLSNRRYRAWLMGVAYSGADGRTVNGLITRGLARLNPIDPQHGKVVAVPTDTEEQDA